MTNNISDDNEKAIDLGYLREVCGGDEDIESELLEMFLAQADEIAESLETALAQKDGGKMAATAHKAKSTALSMGMKNTADILVRLQDMGRNADFAKKDVLSEVDSLIKKCKLQLEKACKAVSDELRTIKAAN